MALLHTHSTSARARHRRPGRCGVAGLAGIAAVLLTTAFASVASGDPAGASATGPYAVGRRLSAQADAPMMETVAIPGLGYVTGSVIARRPGTDEVWMAARASAPSTQTGYANTGYDPQTDHGSQLVFLHHSGHGAWVGTGPPVDGGGNAVNATISTISVAANGEGWAAGVDSTNATVFLHLAQGAQHWRSELLSVPPPGTVYSISVAAPPGSGPPATYGFAVVQNPGGNANQHGVLALSGTTWASDASVNSAVISVAALAPGAAMAVGSYLGLSVIDCLQNQDSVASCVDAVRSRGPGVASSGAVVYRRGSGGWSPMAVSGALAGSLPYTVAADPGTGGPAWIGGLSGQQQSFVASLSTGGATTTWCASGCDAGFPDATTDTPLAEIVALEPVGGDVFAAGNTTGGLLHLPGGSRSWVREPATVGPIGGLAFTSASDGWVTEGGPYGVSQFPAPVVGHWTASPRPAAVRRWPTGSGTRLDAVAVDPGGSGAVLVGGDDGIRRLDPSTGEWFTVLSGTGRVSGISWPSTGDAYAVAGTSIWHAHNGVWRPEAIRGSVGGELRAIAVSTRPVTGGAPGAAPPPTATAPPPAATPPCGGAPTSGAPVAAWGYNADGELGVASAGTQSARPLQLPCPLGVTAVAAGEGFSLAAVGCGTPATCRVYGWGYDLDGQLGAPRPATSLSVPSPQPIANFPPAGRTVTQLAAGGSFSLALLDNGAVYAWGSNANGQLGNGNVSGTGGPAPVAVRGMPGPVTRIAAGFDFALAVSGGSAYGWGDNAQGQLGQPPTLVPSGPPVPTRVPVKGTVVDVAAGPAYGFAVLSDGTVQSWGESDLRNSLGRSCTATLLGLNSCLTPGRVSLPAGVTVRSVAVAPTDSSVAGSAPGTATSHDDNVVALTSGSTPVYIWGDTLPWPQPGPALPPVARVVAGQGFDLALLADETVVGWGLDQAGQLGDGTTLGGSQLQGSPVQALGITSAKSLAAGTQHVLAGLAVGSAVGVPTPSPPPPPAPPPVGTSPGSGPPAVLGYAVGRNGTTVRFDGSAWTVDSPTSVTTADLDTVSISPTDAVAAGQEGTLLTTGGGGWAPASTPAAMGFTAKDTSGTLHPAAPTLMASTALPDGTVLVGGERSTLLERDPGDPAQAFHLSALPPVEGWVHGLSARRDAAGRLHALVVLGRDRQVSETNSRATDPLDLTGMAMTLDPSGGWDEVGTGLVHQDGFEPNRLGAGSAASSDAFSDGHPVTRDDVIGATLEGGGTAGWLVGAHGSVWRLRTDAAPSGSPMEATSPLTAGPGTSFAYIANTGCLQGVCDHQLGWGSRGDAVAVDAARTINALAASGQVRVLLSGGDLRLTGLEDALTPMGGLLDSLRVPAYAAVGARDLDANGSSATWSRAFAGRPAPWGGGPAPATIAAIGSAGGGGAGPGGPGLPILGGGPSSRGGAATAYAFDVLAAPGDTGRHVLRAIVLDTSSSAASGSQAAFLSSALSAAPAGVPAVVVMNTPSAALEATAASLGVAGVLTAQAGANTGGLSGAMPVDTFSSGGGRWPSSSGDYSGGFYQAWQLATVAPDAQGIPRLDVRSVPVLESLYLRAPSGKHTTRGSAIGFNAIGHTPDMGTLDAAGGTDTEPSVGILGFPFPRPCGAPAPGGGPGCRAASVVPPDYRFVSSNPAVLAPVREDPSRPGHPLLDRAGRAIPDESSGLFCGFRPGTATVSVEADGIAARLAVSVSAGSGRECVGLAPPPARPRAPALPKPLVHPQAPVPPVHSGAVPAPTVVAPHLAHARVINPGSGTVVPGVPIPPPAPALPAPPGGSGAGQGAGKEEREEEPEAATEQANMTALLARAGARHDIGDAGSVLPWAGVAVAGSIAAAALGRHRRRLARPDAAWCGQQPWRTR